MSQNGSRVRSLTLLLAPWLALLILAAVAGIYLADRLLIAPQRQLQRQLEEQKLEIARLEGEKQRLETYIKLLRFTERKARIEVLDQRPNESGVPMTRIRFTEIDAAGAHVTAARELVLTGREAFIDALTIRFEDHFVEQGDPLKGRALMLFRRIFTNMMRPEDGFILDRAGQPPEVYAREKSSTDFERNLWSRFWELANDEALARQAGVRAIHGDAPYMRLEPGRIYHVTLRSTGEVSISPGKQLAK